MAIGVGKGRLVLERYVSFGRVRFCSTKVVAVTAERAMFREVVLCECDEITEIRNRHYRVREIVM